jgi:uracil-DNA glycosylase
MDTKKVIEEALKIRDTIKTQMDSVLNPIDMKLNPVPPFKVSDEIKLIIIGQDPTIKNKSQREKISTTLNLNRGGSLATYIMNICDGLGISLKNVYATNIFKYFYSIPPASTMDVLFNHLDLNLRLLRNELQIYAGLPVITLGEPVLQLLSNIPGDKVRKYWDYNKGISGLSFNKCTDNDFDRPFYPFPHQPSIRKEFYNRFLYKYLQYVKDDSGI